MAFLLFFFFLQEPIIISIGNMSCLGCLQSIDLIVQMNTTSTSHFEVCFVFFFKEIKSWSNTEGLGGDHMALAFGKLSNLYKRLLVSFIAAPLL